MLCIGLSLSQLCSVQGPWGAGYCAAEEGLWALPPLLLQAELGLKRGSAVPSQPWELLHVLSLEVLGISDLFFASNRMTFAVLLCECDGNSLLNAGL